MVSKTVVLARTRAKTKTGDPEGGFRYVHRTLVSINTRPTPSGGKFCNSATIILGDEYQFSACKKCFSCILAMPICWHSSSRIIAAA